MNFTPATTRHKAAKEARATQEKELIDEVRNIIEGIICRDAANAHTNRDFEAATMHGLVLDYGHRCSIAAMEKLLSGTIKAELVAAGYKVEVNDDGIDVSWA